MLPETVRTLAVLMQAGATPIIAWRQLAAAGDDGAVVIAEGIDRGDGIAEAVRAQGGAWRDVAAAWAIAATVGAPLGDVLRMIADALEDAEATADEVRVALAEPAGTARLMLWLPAVGLLLGTVLGFDTLPVLFGQPVGLACLVAGLLLIVGARLWTAALVRRAQPSSIVPGMRAELLAVALSGGASIPRAAALVAEETDGEAGESDEDLSVQRVLRLSDAAGVPAVELLRADAARARREERVRGRLGAARLSSRLLLPLGVCTLPAFLLLGVAPLVLSVMATTSLPTGI
ncbi:tight adherence protein B [Microbacterium resistens]|uniref:Tight adherence protein B n=1 Tax=Microbacterium resistens TaxID=156977 RepID=A0ABU1SDP3_9MICO|nr:type II secretion system F family protein [Microbacterium resistens]MDR6867714.1 tight adherence protein B [Microbacterium resistens]